MSRFARVVERDGWVLETVWDGRSVSFRDRQEALDQAVRLAPDWIEVGDVAPATNVTPRRHRWRTLRRQPDGRYLESGLRWA